MRIVLNRYDRFVTFAMILFFAAALIVLSANVRLINKTFDDLIGNDNHEDSLTKPFPGSSCPCGYPGCQCPSDNGISITLEATVIITPLPGQDKPATPNIPTMATVFPTVTAYPTFIFPTVPNPIPTTRPTTAGPTPTFAFHDPNIPQVPDPPTYP